MIKILLLKLFILFLLLQLSSPAAFCQTDSTRYYTIEAISKRIRNNYVDAALADQMCDTLWREFQSGYYNSPLNKDEFMYEVTKDLRRVSNDQHINIVSTHFALDNAVSHKTGNKYRIKNPEKYLKRPKAFFRKAEKNFKKARKAREKKLSEYRKKAAIDSYTYGDIKILPGNTGYVEIKDFESVNSNDKQPGGRISINEVMTYLKNTSAVIFDFRENLGGTIYQSAKFCSYFSKRPGTYFTTSETPVRYDSSLHMKDTSINFTDNTDKHIQFELLKNKKLFILISKRTFSAAELATYKIKQFLPEVTVVGEKTTGGGNGYFGIFSEKYFSGVIPNTRSYDASNGKYNLEGKGVRPDIPVNADSALIIAYMLAIKDNPDTNAQVKKPLKLCKPVDNEKETIFNKYYPDYTGNYRKINISLENGKLIMLYDTYRKLLLIPDGLDYFITEGFEFVKFTRDGNNEMNAIQLKYPDGYLEVFRKQ